MRYPPPAKPGLLDAALPDVRTRRERAASLRLTRAHQSVEEEGTLRGNGGAGLRDANTRPRPQPSRSHCLPHKSPRWRQYVLGWTMKGRCSSRRRTISDEITILRLRGEEKQLARCSSLPQSRTIETILSFCEVLSRIKSPISSHLVGRRDGALGSAHPGDPAGVCC